MLYDLNWLQTGKNFPPIDEQERLTRYRQNILLFDNDQWAIENDVYNNAVQRITRVVGNFEDYICFPVLFNYQKLMALKTADLVAGEYPIITCESEAGKQTIKDIRFDTDFDNNLYATCLDLSRFGDAIWRMYRSADGKKNTYCNWMPTEWFPIVSTDGTFTEKLECLVWPVCIDKEKNIWELHAQVHDVGFYMFYRFEYLATCGLNEKVPTSGTIGKLLEEPTKVSTGFTRNAVIHLRPYKVTGTVYGSDDFAAIDSIIVELTTRMAQISNILDKHADPSLVGPPTLLSLDENGELYFKKGKFYSVSQGEEKPEYLTWDGKIDSAFRQCEFLIKQLYVLSEMGSTLLGADDGGSQAVSGNAMRLKMVNPLAKVRRISNNLTKPVAELFSDLSAKGYTEKLECSQISIVWKDGLPDDPREQIEIVKLLTGKSQIVPLSYALEQYLSVSKESAEAWGDVYEGSSEPDPTGPGSKSGVNPRKKGSKLQPHQTGTNNTNKTSRET